MHPEILSPNQEQFLPFLKRFKRSFYLAGGTAIALHIGHRRSIDFDLFTHSGFNKSRIRSKLRELPFKQTILFEDIDQLHLLLDHLKVTFLHFPFTIDHGVQLKSFISLPSLLTLAALKAYALGRRSKWKDYVDMYFIIKDHHSISEISEEAINCFGSQFSEKLFRQQLAFHKDIDYSEQVEYIVPALPESEIKEFLILKATDIGI